MRPLSYKINPTPEQLKVIGDVKPGFRIIRGAAGSGKTTTSVLRLREEIRVRTGQHRRLGLTQPVRALVLTFNRTLVGYLRELALPSMTDDELLDLEIRTFASWALSLLGQVPIAERREQEALLKSQILNLINPRRSESFLFDEIAYLRSRFEPEHLSDYLGARRYGRGRAPRMDRNLRLSLLNAVDGYQTAKRERGVVDWDDLAIFARDAPNDSLYDLVIVDEAQDFSANQIRALLSHLHPEHSTTFVVDATQRIYPRYLRWSEVGINVRRIDTLRENYRNTAQIARFALPLVSDLPPEEDATLPDFTACTRQGPKPLVVEGRFRSQFALMLERLNETTDLTTETAAVLHPLGGGWFREARLQLGRRGIRFCELTRKSEWPKGSEPVALCTMHSAKGLEFDHVLIPGLNQEVTPHGGEPGDANLDQLRRMLAMAIGRARKSVMVGHKPGEPSSLIARLNPSTYDLVSV